MLQLQTKFSKSIPCTNKQLQKKANVCPVPLICKAWSSTCNLKAWCHHPQKEGISPVTIVKYFRRATGSEIYVFYLNIMSSFIRLLTASSQVYLKYCWLEDIRTLRGEKHIKPTHLNPGKGKDPHYYLYQMLMLCINLDLTDY